ncbi:hypothetical protein RNI52_05220 [Labrys neptuniae]|uniref:hypothetical protein n=1 Tax=Labrys neptuniae TaxID=376174 RepID=UPI00288F28F7|nr:hypothetical protein [Labrys neptuniae]MDT3376722.1 hypothetical protein [Labrys neptuniae]
MSEDRALQPPGDRPALVLLFHLAFSLLGIALASLMAALVYVSAAALQGGKFFPLELQESFPAATPVTSLAALTRCLQSFPPC